MQGFMHFYCGKQSDTHIGVNRTLGMKM